MAQKDNCNPNFKIFGTVDKIPGQPTGKAKKELLEGDTLLLALKEGTF
jgi:hypothetical protein